VIDQRDHLTVVLLRAHHHLLLDDLHHLDLHQVDQVLIALHLRAHNHERNVLPVVDDLIAQVQRVKSLKVVKSAIHAGFVPPHKSAINHVFAPASLNQIFLKMSQVKSLRKVFAQSY
jgi:ABC-type enterochelin transport system ATPase subunit